MKCNICDYHGDLVVEEKGFGSGSPHPECLKGHWDEWGPDNNPDLCDDFGQVKNKEKT